jgi:hypothetical protein
VRNETSQSEEGNEEGQTEEKEVSGRKSEEEKEIYIFCLT